MDKGRVQKMIHPSLTLHSPFTQYNIVLFTMLYTSKILHIHKHKHKHNARAFYFIF